MPDLFLSYAHVDKHWVDTFAPLLEQRVNQYVGRSKPDRLWKDNRLTGNQPFSPEIHTQLNTAQCLVACLSPGYLASEWCIKELNEFSQRVGIQTGRIFYLEPDEVPQTDKPEILTQSLGYRFWRQDALSKRSYPLYPGEAAYETMLTDLAKDIAGALRERNPVQQPSMISEPAQQNQSPNLSTIPKNNAALHARCERLQTMLSRLEEQYDLESREEERMRMERIIEEKRFALHQIEAQIIREKFL